MKKSGEPNRNRRELFRTIGRYAALAGLGLAAAAAWGGKKPSARGRSSCIDPIACRDCGKLGRCPLPAARTASIAAREGKFHEGE